MAVTRRQQKAAEEVTRRRAQLASAQAALGAAEITLRSLQASKRLSSHVDGFYTEIDKLAKGRALLPVTDLVVEQANDIIRDAKVIIADDVYLDRIKEFVPAGDNPTYPDVLVVARSVRQALKRFGEAVPEQKLTSRILELRMIIRALSSLIDHGKHLSKLQIPDLIHPKVKSDWFFEAADGEEYFDYDRLDGFPSVLSS